MTDVAEASTATLSASPPPADGGKRELKKKQIALDLGFLPIPKRLRHDPESPPKFGLVLNATFGFASTFVVSNLYYCQPLLIEFSKSFNVSYDRVSNIPTLVQAGYATGLVLISPLGDLVRRRPLILLLVILSGSLSIGLCITNSLAVFEALCFLVGVVTVTPQILMPLAADLAPPERKASAISIVLSGLLFGILIARVLAGIIAQFASWRVVYYFAVGVQFLCLAMLYLVLPDYPAKNPDMSYFGILWTMAKFAVTEPILIQTCLINVASSANFTNFWVTLTFLLGGPPYHYSTVDIGLFGLVGMFGVAMGPLIGRLIDRLVPWYATLVGTLALLVFQSIQTGAGGVNIAAVIIVCFGLDVFRQMQQVSLTTVVYTIDEKARARLNAVVLLSLFIGQVMGTSVGTKIFVEHGWRAASGLAMGFLGWQLLILLLRGPHCGRFTWFGYEGGLEPRKGVVMERKRREEAEKNGVRVNDDGNERQDEKVVEGGQEDRTEKRGGAEDPGLQEDVKEKDPSRMV
ncbi:MFS general substrate transporter [Gloeophyllum trabeum ATCC 11539]|uniref:MFS general substrate transporter n=1 Tax=Gloeophyllum trabeum (strain ATCC 11539 / FP-39264 / Madison 617) TaxID=670483 RepID=S7RKI4_GLOTA|nr:MFS general substrate transporter [Gloeophyllum trabeum ATCC 11539]EPQ54895.1 MFS general substrate transporter [Gloeophyllum trabeum ATCC 11539]